MDAVFFSIPIIQQSGASIFLLKMVYKGRGALYIAALK
jgi:hypothetical protein